MKRVLSLVLTAVMLFSALPGALADDAIPSAPEWVTEENYLIFPGDAVYAPESWAGVLERREAARRKGALLPHEDRGWVDGSPGLCYETALTRLRLAYNYEGDGAEAHAAYLAAGDAFNAAQTGWGDLHPERDETYYRLAVEKYRCYLRYHVDYVDDWGRALVPVLDELAMPLSDFFDAIRMERVSAADRERVAAEVAAYWSIYTEQRSRVQIWLDGAPLFMDTPTQVARQRVMAPVRALAEALGAVVTWDPRAHQVTMTRAGSTVTMTLGSAIAQVDGTQVLMDVAPYADQNRTYFPVRYAAELFGQRVEWNGAERRVEITEDKPAGADERWALAMGALLTAAQGGDPEVFGGGPRPRRAQDAPSPAIVCRALLRENWDIPDRGALLANLADLSRGGHNADFLSAAEEIESLTAPEIDSRTARMDEVDQYMWPRTRALWKKWGEKGILAWDLCLTANLVQWGYTAGYLTYSEAMGLIAPAAQTLEETFSDWDEVYENFVDGYYWCVQEDVGGAETMDTALGRSYLYLRHSPDTRTLFNNEMFPAGKD